MKYLLLLAKQSTGQVLHTDGNSIFYSRNEGSSSLPYIFVSNLANAEREAQEIVDKRSDLEIAIYDTNDKHIKTIYGNYVASPIKKDKWWKFW